MALWIALLVSVLLPTQGRSAPKERLGEFSWNRLHLQPTMTQQESEGAQFSLKDSSFGVEWNYQRRFTARILLGQKSLLSTPSYLSESVDEDEDQLALIEAYGQYNGTYAEVRFGQIPVGFGAEGRRSEAELFMPRSLQFSEQISPLRDQGLSIHLESRGWVNSWYVHNGGDSEGDTRVWLTGLWGYRTKPGGFFGLSLQTGSTKPEVTEDSQSTLAGFDPSEETRWRRALLFLEYQDQNWWVQGEGHIGERLVDDERVASYSVWHIDFYRFWSRSAFAFRVDQLDPNKDLQEDIVTNLTAGFYFFDKYRLNRLGLLYTKRLEQANQVDNDQILLHLRVTNLQF